MLCGDSWRNERWGFINEGELGVVLTERAMYYTIPPKIGSLVIDVSDHGLMWYKFLDRVTGLTKEKRFDPLYYVQGGESSKDA